MGLATVGVLLTTFFINNAAPVRPEPGPVVRRTENVVMCCCCVIRTCCCGLKELQPGDDSDDDGDDVDPGELRFSSSIY